METQPMATHSLLVGAPHRLHLLIPGLERKVGILRPNLLMAFCTPYLLSHYFI